MAVIVMSTFSPQTGNKERVANLLEAVDIAFAQQAGYVLGLRFSGMNDSDELGRIFVWESIEAGRDAEASMEASPLLRRIRNLSEECGTNNVYFLEGYALKPN